MGEGDPGATAQEAAAEEFAAEELPMPELGPDGGDGP
jgi:hypothetical protein